MLSQSAVSFQQINNYYVEKVQARRLEIQKVIHIVAKVVQEVLKEVELQEPRFISTLNESNGRYEGLIVHSPYEYEVILYLNQMGVFNFVDDGSIQGCAVLKLSDGRKRSMSLWVEFITASGYLSARKIRSRFQALVTQAIEKPQFNNTCKLLTNTSDVKLLIYDKYTVQITCAFRCTSIWPRSASQWPNPSLSWPSVEMAKEVRCEGFDLFSKEMSPQNCAQATQSGQLHNAGGINHAQQKTSMSAGNSGVPMSSANPNNSSGGAGGNNTMEGDAWAMSMTQAENILLSNVNRRKAYSILKTMRDRHLDYIDSPITNYIIKTLTLYECEKHCGDHEWHEFCLSDRIIGILLQLVSCLQCRRCPHYFLPQLDLLRGKPPHVLDRAAKAAWNLVRQLLLNARALENL